MSAPRKYAIAGNVGTRLLFWTGGKRMPWSTMSSKARRWSSDTVAATWLARVPFASDVVNLRVLEVAP